MFTISDLELRNGRLGLSPIPGRSGAFEADVSTILRWGADMVLTMVTAPELRHAGAERLEADLIAGGVIWRHLPVGDMGAPRGQTAADWPGVSGEAHRILDGGGRVLTHCYGGCGRAGMAAMRLMVEAGEEPDYALERLRESRGCAVQSEAQRAWAAIPAFERKGWTQ